MRPKVAGTLQATSDATLGRAAPAICGRSRAGHSTRAATRARRIATSSHEGKRGVPTRRWGVVQAGRIGAGVFRANVAPLRGVTGAPAPGALR